MIEIQALTKYYGARRVVGPISISIAKGEIVGLLGLNGAGKTTTLRILACDLLPSSGSVRVDGLDVVDNPDEVRARVGYLPDAPPLYDEMTVGEYLVFAARLRGLGQEDAEARVEEVLVSTQLDRVRDDVISTLSHGFRQRVGIAQAVVHRPRLLVLDEPISGLDPVQIVEMRELVRNLRHHHTTIISSHILSEISETCDRILVIRDGEIVAAGTEAELSSRLVEGAEVVVTVRGDAGQAKRLLASVKGVTAVEPVDATEPGADISSFRVEAERDVRQELCRALVLGDVALLGIAKNDRELESIFLRLAQPESKNGAEVQA
ncbi:MAG TPA: ABC transporter ATP-binding protein [Polyangiaceae bacterium]|nr:ABC transporter ATP-binding protein [Polyangiaceae bacterium]